MGWLGPDRDRPAGRPFPDMLGLHGVSSGGIDYYLNDLAQEVPAEDRAMWAGRAAERMGLTGPLQPTQLRRALEGRHPLSDQQLRSQRATVSGVDLTFSAPKSVSVLFGLGGAPMARQIIEAHQQSVTGAVRYLEDRAVTAQRGSGEQRRSVSTSGLVAGAFTHAVNRNGDPHVHTHVVVANLVHGEDGRWSACDRRGMSAHREAASALYNAGLRRALSRDMGLRWSPTGMQGWELAGVPPALLGEFSSRSADIRRRMAEWGTHSKRGARVAWAATRPEKEAGHSFEALQIDWIRRAGAVGEELSLAKVRSDHEQFVDEHRFHGSLSLSADGGARRRDLVRAFGEATPEGATAEDIGQLTQLWLPADSALGIHEQVHALREVVPPGHLLRALGPRPVDPERHGVWRGAAQSLESYGRQWGVGHVGDALDLEQRNGSMSSFSVPRLVAHLEMSRQLETARQRLGWRPPHRLEIERSR
jgi:conjugative relaxase-like TrwC/TraI family protein